LYKLCLYNSLSLSSTTFIILLLFNSAIVPSYPRIKQSVNQVALQDGQIRDPSPMDLRPLLQPYTWSQPESARGATWHL
jgi:hypothetical protein